MFKRIHDLGKDMMSIEDLRTMLKGQIWFGKFEEGADVYELLMALPNTDAGDRKVSKNDLLVLCYLICGGDN